MSLNLGELQGIRTITRWPNGRKEAGNPFAPCMKFLPKPRQNCPQRGHILLACRNTPWKSLCTDSSETRHSWILCPGGHCKAGCHQGTTPRFYPRLHASRDGMDDPSFSNVIGRPHLGCMSYSEFWSRVEMPGRERERDQ